MRKIFFISGFVLSLLFVSLALGQDLQGTAGETSAEKAVATFAGGCFWCMEPPFDKTAGVLSTTAGYIGGEVKDPSYEQVSQGGTGHAEAVQVMYDPSKVSYKTLLEVFWKNIDPFDPKGQFCDKGDQYRAAVFYHTPEQKRMAEKSKQRVGEHSEKDVMTTIEKATTFYEAEGYHQNYYEKNPIRYNVYRRLCGRDARLEAVWGE